MKWVAPVAIVAWVLSFAAGIAAYADPAGRHVLKLIYHYAYQWQTAITGLIAIGVAWVTIRSTFKMAQKTADATLEAAKIAADATHRSVDRTFEREDQRELEEQKARQAAQERNVHSFVRSTQSLIRKLDDQIEWGLSRLRTAHGVIRQSPLQFIGLASGHFRAHTEQAASLPADGWRLFSALQTALEDSEEIAGELTVVDARQRLEAIRGALRAFRDYASAFGAEVVLDQTM